MRPSVILGVLVVLVCVAFTTSLRAADEIPEPRLDRIDYAHPEKYVDVPESLARKATIGKIAGEIAGSTAAEKLAAIGAWIDAHAKYDASTFDRWRDVDRLLADGTYGGCADHATLFGAISRGCGIPTVWVKTLDLDWIAWFRAHPDRPKSWNGHVFVEVHVDGRWRLFDASQKRLYADYDVKQRILPGHRLADDKGGDPYELLLSTRWEDWKKQTRRFVQTLDMSLVPVGEAKSLRVDPAGGVYVAADNPEWTWICERVKALDLRIGPSGNCDWEDWMPAARRGVLIVAAIGGRTVLPESYWPLLPAAPAKFGEALADRASVVLRKKAADGTDVVLFLARDKEALRSALAEFTLDGSKATPPSGARRTVYVVGRTAEFQALADRCKKLGAGVSGGDCAFEKWLPGARGGLLVVCAVAGEMILPQEYRALLPADADAVRDLLKTKESGVLRKKAPDGTDVVLLAARDKETMRGVIEGLALDPAK